MNWQPPSSTPPSDAGGDDSEQARDGADKVTVDTAENDQQYAGIGPRAADREYRDVPDDDKPHPSTIMQQEVLPSDSVSDDDGDDD